MPSPVVFAWLMVIGAWLAAAGLLVAWWWDDATGWVALWEVVAAVGLALWAGASE